MAIPAPIQSVEDLHLRVEENHVRFIDLQFTDVVGIVKNITIPVNELDSAITHGIWFDGSRLKALPGLQRATCICAPI